MAQKRLISVIVIFIILVLAVVGFLVFKALLNPAKPAANTDFNVLPLSTPVPGTAKAEPSTPIATLGQVTTPTPFVPNSLLTITKTVNPQTYDHIGQTITYTYVITNSGNVAIGPDQFIVNDTGLDAPLACGDPNTTLAPAQTLTCSATHVITQADMDAASITTSATVSGGGIQATFPANLTILKGLGVPPTTTAPSNLTQGTNIQHTVVNGEWLWQIARCYGADPKQVVQANSQLPDVDLISPGMVVSVPNIGSKGTNFGPPCLATYTVQSGDTWNSIAQKYGADPVILQRANPGSLSAGWVIIIPLHSAS
jgi:uncharacterized repeat protein (TIGR01451 family)